MIHALPHTLCILIILLSFFLSNSTNLLAYSRPNIIFIFIDDLGWGDVGCYGNDFIDTPNIDQLAKDGMRFTDFYAAGAVCSPTRCAVQSGQNQARIGITAHIPGHWRPFERVINPQTTMALPLDVVTVAESMKDAGYTTGYVGKWHMGHEDDTPRKGFDHWVSFAGQGTYFDPTFNINGKRKDFKGYNADLLTDQAIDWLKQVGPASKKGKPFFLQVGYKAVHYPFQPPPRHAKRYEGKKIDYPETMANTEENYLSQSLWIKERRYGIHGIDHMETGALDKDPVPSFDELYHNFCETVHALDENVGRVLDQLDKLGIADDTLVIYLGDNGFALGEHGFYDKRDAFEESIRIPMLARHPKLIKAGARVEKMALNVDLAPTILEYAGVDLPKKPKMDGQSLLPLLKGQKNKKKWREHFVYEYHWEWNFPATPTTFAIRTDSEKYVFYHGVWDRNGFYDLKSDPHERHNLIRVPAYRERILELREKLFDELDSSGGLSIPIRRPKNEQFYDRKLPR